MVRPGDTDVDMVQDVRVLLLRVSLPDVPGALGMVASAMGAVGADISAVEIVEKGGAQVVDDFMLDLPPSVPHDELVSACTALEGVRVLWISRYPESWGIESDIELIDHMVAAPARAAEVLATEAPAVFHCQWAAVVDLAAGRVVAGSEQAPELDAASLALLGDLTRPGRVELDSGWLPNWGDAVCAHAPVSGGRAVVLGRVGGPEFLDSEVRRLQHLSGLV